MLRRTRVERSQTNDYEAGSTITVPETASVRHPLCDVCLDWLTAVTGNLAEPGRSRGLTLLGAPASRRRVRIFPDQCLLCREMLGDAAIVVDSTTRGGSAGPLPSMLVCGACDTWIGGLADDGRSARGGAERAIDGVYGTWPHPNLRSLDVSLHITDAAIAARFVIAATACTSRWSNEERAIRRSRSSKRASTDERACSSTKTSAAGPGGCPRPSRR